MSHRTIFHAVVERLRRDHHGMKVNGELKGFVPSDRIVRYLAEVQRRRAHDMRSRAGTP